MNVPSIIHFQSIIFKTILLITVLVLPISLFCKDNGHPITDKEGKYFSSIKHQKSMVSSSAPFTNEGSEVGLLWQYFGNNDWSSNYVTIQPGATYTQIVADGEVWEIWNQADDTRFAEFNINCNDNTNYIFTTGSGVGGGNGNDCCAKRGGIIDRPTKLTFTYTGGGCSFNSTNASEGKHLCINGTVVNGPQSISIIAEGELIGGARTINEGDNIEIYVKNGGGNSFGNELQVKIGTQIVEIHTSCSDALVSGENYGALRLEAVEGENGITCGTVPPPCTLTGGVIEGNQSGCISDGAFNPTILTSLEIASFDGTCNTVPPSSGNCCEEHGDHNHLQKIALKYVGSSSTTITAYADKAGSALLYAGTTNPNDIILLDASSISGSAYDDRFDSGAKVQVGNTTFELHSSCSNSIDAGMGISASGGLITNPDPSDTNILFIVEGLSTPDGCSEGTLGATIITTDETISYHWQHLLSNGQWTDIAGATGLTYDPPSTTETIQYRRIATNCCGQAISNVITISVTSLTGGKIAGEQSECITSGTFDPSILTSVEPAFSSEPTTITPPSSGNCCEEHGDHNHLQKIALRYVGSSSTTIIAYADKAGDALLYNGTANPGDIILLDASNISGSAYNDRFDSGAKVQVGGTTFELHSSCSNSIDAGMGISASGGLITNPDESDPNILFIVEGLSTPDGCSEGTFETVLTTITDETINYQWQYLAFNGQWTNIEGATGLSYDPLPTNQTIQYRRVASNNCEQAFSNVITILVTSLTGGSISGNQTACITSGSFTPTMLTSVENAFFSGVCNTIPVLPPSQDNCCEEHGDHNHLQKIALRYVGSSSTTITAYADKDGDALLYNGTTSPNDIILLDASNISGSAYDDRFDSGAKVQVGNTTFELHSSCSNSIDAGMGISTSGGLITNPDPSNTNILFIVEGLSTPDGCSEGSFNTEITPIDSEVISYQWQFQLSNGDWTDITGANTANYNPPATSQTIKYRRVAANCCGTAISNEIVISITTEAPPIENCAYRIQAGTAWITGNCTPVVCINSRLELSVSPNNYSSYQWSGPNGFSGSGNQDGDILIANTLTGNQAGTYTVTVTDENGCTNTSTINVTLKDCVCDLSVEVLDKVYMDNNTTNTALHTFSYNLKINGPSGDKWIMYDVVNGNKNHIINTGSYGQLLNLGPYPINQEGTLFIFVDANNRKCQQSIGVNMSDCVYTGTCHCANKNSK